MPDPIRIAFIAPYPASALLPEDAVKPKYRHAEHPATWVRLLAEHIGEMKGVELRVFVDSRAVTTTHQASLCGVPFVYVPKQEPIRSDPYHLFTPSYLRLRKTIESFHPHVVVGFGIESGCATIASYFNVPSVFFIQGIMEVTNPFRPISAVSKKMTEAIERRTVRKVDALIAETGFARGWALTVDPRASVTVIPHPLNPDFLGVEPDRNSKRILCVGTLHEIKGPDTVIRAFAGLKDTQSELIMVGSGALRDRMATLAAELGVAARVTFKGQCSTGDVMKEMAAARVLAIGSRMDTSPNVVTEAHAAGLPVVGTTAGGIPDMVDHGVDGYLVRVEDHAGMTNYLDRLLADEALARSLGEAGREKVRHLNDPRRVSAEHVAFYRDVFAQKTRQAIRRRMTFSPKQASLVRRAASLIPVSLRQGSTYWSWRRRLEEVRSLPRREIEAAQLAQVRDLVRYACEHTEGYRNLYKDAGMSWEDIRTLADFRKAPFVTKALLRDNLDAFSVKVRGRRYGTTGGSTGIPMGFYYTSTTKQIETAFMHDNWARTGWHLGMRTAVLRGGFVGTKDWIADYDPYHRELRLSSYHLTASTLPRYIEAIRAHKITVLQAYPSSLNMLCDLLREAGAAGQVSLEIIFLGSENVYDWQLEKFEKTFPGARILAWYGQAEQVILAAWCETRRTYHARPFYGLTEVIKKDGSPAQPGDEGDLIGTNFHNRVTPFIRYKTMDRAIVGESPCPSCGRDVLILDKVIGRMQEVIITATGRYIAMTSINMHDDIFDGLRQFQFLQDQKGKLTFKYVARAPLPPSTLARMRDGLSAKLGSDVELTLQAVSDIPRSSSGKYRFLDQRLSLAYGDR